MKRRLFATDLLHRRYYAEELKKFGIDLSR
jgi:hypothetical protein